MSPNARLDIPVIDLDDLTSDDRARREAADRILCESLARFGLIHVRGHGIDRGDLEALYADFTGFTQRPEAEKRQFAGSDIWYQRGWTPANTEKAVVAGGQPDFKECFFAAPLPVDPVCAVEHPQLYAENRWPDREGAFRRLYLRIGRQLHAVGLTLLRGAARGLDLPQHTFMSGCEGAAHVTRLLRYLEVSAERLEQGVLWGEEHTDFNLLTLLPGGQFYDPRGQSCPKPEGAGGLYLRTRGTADNPVGVRIPGGAPAGCLVAQVGQQLEILTGGRLQATPHEITAPEQPGYTRCSMAHFIHLHAHQLVAPLPRFRTREAIGAYGPAVLAGTYGTKTLVDIGLAPAEALNTLGYRHYDRLADQRAEEGR